MNHFFRPICLFVAKLKSWVPFEFFLLVFSFCFLYIIAKMNKCYFCVVKLSSTSKVLGNWSQLLNSWCIGMHHWFLKKKKKRKEILMIESVRCAWTWSQIVTRQWRINDKVLEAYPETDTQVFGAKLVSAWKDIIIIK